MTFKLSTTILLIILLLFSSCIPFRALYLLSPDPKDVQRFPNKTIQKSEAPFLFHQQPKDYTLSLKVNDWTTDVPVFRPLHDILSDHAVNAFLMIRNDSLLAEHYFNDYDAQSLHPSYSVAKSFTSALIGIAIDEQHIKSVEEPITNYLSELDYDDRFSQVRISDLLNHTSNFQPYQAEDAHLYYGKNLEKPLQDIRFEGTPGTTQRYSNMNTELLGIIITRTTGQSPAEYLSNKVWKNIGTESNALWSTEEKQQQEKTFCCLNATARDYAKFGRLFLQQGEWQGKQIISKDWVQASTKRDTLRGSSHAYQYSWHLGTSAYDDFMAVGLYKQYIYMHPEKNIIMVLLCSKEKEIKEEMVNWPYVFRQLVDLL